MKKIDFEKKFLPALTLLGFTAFPALDKQTAWHFPLGALKRTVGEHIHQIEIQRDKYHKDRFRILFGIIPLSGVHAPHAGHIRAEDMLVTWLPDYYEMYRSPFLRRFFHVRDLERSDDIIDEIEQLFQSGRKGKRTRHIHFYKPRPLDPSL